MGTFSKGILGGFSGTVGTVIGGSWKGISYMRSRPQRTSSASSQAQIEQRAKFKMVVRLFQSMTGLMRISFKEFTTKMTGFNAAVSYTLKNAVAGSYPAYDIDYSLALVARGDLPNGGSPSATPNGSGIVKFAWTDNSGIGKAKATDKAILVVYCPFFNQSLYTTGSARRIAGDENFDCSVFSGQVCETWISFISEDGKDVATSIYTGQLTV